MKKLLTIVTSLIVCVGCLGASTGISFATTSVQSAKTDYENALKTEQAAKEAYKAAAAEYKKGSYGFYQWIADNYDGWMKEDAIEAMELLDKTSFKRYTKIGAKRDATELQNMKRAIELLPVLQKKRANDNNFPDLQVPTVRSVYMARSQVNANASAYRMEHMDEDKGYPTSESNECLCWGLSDPFEAWYDDEKAEYDKMRKYILRNYNVDINDSEAFDSLYESLSDSELQKLFSKFGETGHYTNVCCGYIDTFSSDGEDTIEKANLAIFGLGLSKNDGWDSGCFCLSGDVFDTYDTAYSIAEYTDLFNTYYNMVYPAAEDAAYSSAKAGKKAALKALKKAATPAKPTVKRSNKKVTVKWKKVSGVDGYEISVAPTSWKTKVAASAGKNAKKKVVKINEAKKQYVMIRSYINIGGEKIYSNWSKISNTK